MLSLETPHETVTRVRLASLTWRLGGAVGGVVSRPNLTSTRVIGPAGNLQVRCVCAHRPPQPPNVDVPSGCAVSVTTAPNVRRLVHWAPQSMSVAVTVPPPPPSFLTCSSTLIVVSSCGGGSPPKVTPAQVFSSSTTIVHVRWFAGRQPPFQPLKSPPVTVS